MALEVQKAPVSEVDPFCRDFFEDPFPAHEELRESGPVVRLSRYGVWAVARYDEVHRVLNDWQTFCSSRGVVPRAVRPIARRSLIGAGRV